MAAARDALVASVEAAVEGAVALASREDLPSVLQSLSSRELSRLWAALSLHVSAAVRDASPVLSPEDAAPPAADEAVQLSLRLLHAAAVIARACAPLEAPAALVDVAVRLHDLIFDISDPRASWVQAAIVDMCEAFWLAEAAAREALVPQMITYLVVRALHEAASAADVKRLYACRGALKALDYADEYTAPLKKLLLHCAIKPQVLRSAEGRKLLVFLFGLHPPFILELHRAIKAQLAVCRKSLRLLYGEVYFRAWRMASGPYVVKMEESVLQDLMFHAVHASSTSMATALMQVLAYTHEQKRQRGVDEMLLRLYEPILWRSLNVANPHVRRNAAAILIEAFPLQDPNKPNVELDQLMQLQFDALQALLKDEVIAVRVVAVQGVCRVLALFWDLIPTPTARLLLSLLVKELAHDASANSVRVAVFQGLRFLLANGASAAIAVLLKGAWSSLAPLINDGSERVRCAMLDFLIEASKSRALHWQFLVKPEMLLPRLAVERPALQLRLVRLLLPLYVPQGRTAALQLGRLLSLIHEWPQAACLLLKHAPSFSSAATLAKLLSHLLGAALSSASAAEITAAKSVAALPPRDEPLDSAQLAALVGAAASLFDAVGPALAAKEHASARAAMVDDFNAAAMGRLEAAAHASAAAQRALMAIAAWLPAESLPGLAKDCLSELAKLPPDASTAQLSPLLQCAIAWQQDGELLEQVSHALSGPDAMSAGSKRGRQTKSRPSRGMPADGAALDARLALRVLWAALSHPTIRAALLSRQPARLAALLPLLAAAPHAPLAASCSLQLAWHLAAASLCAPPPPPRARRGRAALDPPPAAAADAADAALSAAREALSAALRRTAEAAAAAEAEAEAEGVLAPRGANAEASPGEARPKARARTGGEAAEAAAAAAAPSARALLAAWAAEGCALGLFDARLAEEAAEFTAAALRTARHGVAADAAALEQLLPHAAKLTVQLFELAGCAEPAEGAAYTQHALSLLFTILGVAPPSAASLRALRALLLEVFLLVQLHGGEQPAQLVRRLLQLVVNAMPPQRDEPSRAGGGVPALRLPPVAAEVLELLLLRSSGCAAELLPCAQQLLRANAAAPAVAQRCLRLLLACDATHRASQPGLPSLKRHLHALLADAPPPDEADGLPADGSPRILLAHTAEMLLSALG